MAKFKKIKGSITAPLGFRAAALFCNVKTLGTGKGSNKGQKHDLALIVSDVPAKAAAEGLALACQVFPQTDLTIEYFRHVGGNKPDNNNYEEVTS